MIKKITVNPYKDNNNYSHHFHIDYHWYYHYHNRSFLFKKNELLSLLSSRFWLLQELEHCTETLIDLENTYKLNKLVQLVQKHITCFWQVLVVLSLMFSRTDLVLCSTARISSTVWLEKSASLSTSASQETVQ